LAWATTYQQQYGISFIDGFVCPEDPNSIYYEIEAAYPSLKNYYGLLTGAAFTLPFAFATIFSGVLVDKTTNRPLFLSVPMLLLGSFSFLQGKVDSFPLFSLARVV